MKAARSALASIMPAMAMLLPLLSACSLANEGGHPRIQASAVAIQAPSPNPSDARSPIWRPPLEATWQWQLSELPLDLSPDALVYDIDLFDSHVDEIAALHAAGRKVFCYLNAGAWEDWRPDRDLFPERVLGLEYQGWPGERWLDIRQIESLAPIMTARMELCRAKGFDGIEPDNIDGYQNPTGFPLTYQDQLAYNLWLAEQAHLRGLSIGLKNNSEQVEDLLPHFDWAMTEDCFADGWCELFSPFIAAGKPVFAAEYLDTGMSLEILCPQAARLRFSAIIKDRQLSSFRLTCR